ncbi:hypothetical protein NDN08_006892 [Rhodosorus marinus]|uniref:Fanconi anemia group D2 protein n=1 Tax=Rhodosorus marinus TaxID=101924 RepID=A0AAV8UJ81_9RHOD|nr:hypothetical protein NDN08_006892 [Rhodosorus marinus]
MSSSPGKRSRSDAVDSVDLEQEFDEGELKEKLLKGGLRISPCGGHYVVENVHQLVRELRFGIIAESSASSARIADIMANLEQSWSDVEKFRRSLVPFRSPDECTSSKFLFGRDTLVKVLLAIDSLQTGVLNVLLQRIPELTMEEDEGGESYTDLAKLAVSQMRWLDFVVDGAALSETLLDVISACPERIQRELILVTPELVQDAQHSTAVDVLITLLENSPELSEPILRALNGLILGSQASTACNTVLRALSSSEPDHVPFMIRFLVCSAPSFLIPESVNKMRRIFAQRSLGPGAAKLALEEFRDGIRARLEFGDMAMQSLKDSQEKYCPGDLWMMLALLDVLSFRKRIESLVKLALIRGHISSDLFSSAFETHQDALSGFSTSMIKFANLTMCSGSESAAEISQKQYLLLYKMNDRNDLHREIIGSLLEHVGCRKTKIVRRAFDCLIYIAQNVDLSAFMPFLGGLLDFLESFEDEQVSQVFELLGTVRIRSGQIENDQSLEIILRKELTHVDEKFRRIGVLGSCTLAQVFSEEKAAQDQAKAILALLFKSVENNRSAEALAYKQLALTCEKDRMERSLTKAIRRKCLKVFEARFAGKLEDKPSSILDMDIEAKYNLDGEDASISIPIVALAHKGRLGDAHTLCPLIELLCETTKRLASGSLDDTDAILGCPLWMPADSVLDSLSDQAMPVQVAAATSLLLAAMWIRCIVNAFSTSTSADIQGAICERIENLYTIEESLQDLINQQPVCKDAVGEFLGVKATKPLKLSDFLRPLDVAVTGVIVSNAHNASVSTGEAQLVLHELNLFCTHRSRYLPRERKTAITALTSLRVFVFNPGEGAMDESDCVCLRMALHCLAVAIGNEGLVHEKDFYGLLFNLAPKESNDDDTEIGKWEPAELGTKFFRSLVARMECMEDDDESHDLVTKMEFARLLTAAALRTGSAELASEVASQIDKILDRALEESEKHGRVSNYVAELVGMRMKLSSDELDVISNMLKRPTENTTLVKVLLDELQRVAANCPSNIDQLRALFNAHSELVDRSRDQPTVFGSLMKCGRTVAQAFSGKMIPCLRERLNTHRQESLQLIKDFQRSTRVLQHICTHVKAQKSSKQTPLVPSLKRALETVIFSVKGLLESNDASSAFWMGNLKHRNLQGDVVASQAYHRAGDTETATQASTVRSCGESELSQLPEAPSKEEDQNHEELASESNPSETNEGSAEGATENNDEERPDGLKMFEEAAANSDDDQ